MMTNSSLLELGSSRVEDLMQESAVISPSSTISEIVGILSNTGGYEVFIGLQNKVGMVTSRDLLKVTNIIKSKVSSLIKYIPRIERGTTLQEAARIMSEHRIRALPILEKGTIIGQIHAKSIAERIGRMEEVRRLKAAVIMTPNPITISRQSLVTKARSLMIRRQIDHLPVMDVGIYGILTSSHIVNGLLPPDSAGIGARGLRSERRLDFPADTLLQRQFTLSDEADDISRVVQRMINRGTPYTLVTRLGELTGIITYRDIIRLIANSIEEEETPISLLGLPSDPFESELIKKKFKTIVSTMRRAYPDITKASLVIRTTTNDRRSRDRYEVTVRLSRPGKVHSYSDWGWNLASVCDKLTLRLKKLLYTRSGKRTRRYKVLLHEPNLIMSDG